MEKKLKVGLVGMGFGANFAPIFKYHPSTELYALCRRNAVELEKVGKDLGVTNLFTDFREMLSLKELDAILIMSPVSEHFAMAKASLEAGKHTAVTVPMAETREQCLEILETRKRSGKVYMMFETAVYTRTYLYLKELLDSGKLGKIQFFARFASTEYEYARLARFLVRFSADAVRYACVVTTACITR